MAEEKEHKTRVFMYDGQEVAQDPGPEYSIDDVREALAQYFPELAQATHTSEDREDGTVAVTFAKRAGTKGMTYGNLPGRVVREDFWPKCSNCRHFAECEAGHPHHSAFPHSWHWGREAKRFGDGTMLVYRSWVGTIAIGEPHTGCTVYSVDEAQFLEPQKHHRRWLDLENRLRRLDAEINRREERGDFDLCLELYARWNRLFEQQQALDLECVTP